MALRQPAVAYGERAAGRVAAARCGGPAALPPPVAAVRRATHKAIAAVTDDLDKFRFNRAVARIRELTNALDELPAAEPGAPEVLREGLETLARLIGPMMPHLAEEMWQELGRSGLLAEQPWPRADPGLTRDEQVTLAVQINGKLRATLDMPRDTASRRSRTRLWPCRRWRAGWTAVRRARSSSCRTGSSTSLPDEMSNPGRMLISLAATAAQLLSGCGWTPLYADVDEPATRNCERSRSIRFLNGSASDSKSLCAIRSTQPANDDTTRYRLATTLVSLCNLGIQSQGLATLGQLDATATFRLIDLQTGGILLINTVHVANSFDLNPNQYSTIVGEDDAAVRSVAELDQEIVTRLTLFMQRRAEENRKAPEKL